MDNGEGGNRSGGRRGPGPGFGRRSVEPPVGGNPWPGRGDAREERQAEHMRRRGRGPRDRVNLDIETIVDAAMAIADREGLAAMTMRRIAADLGVGVMSLYWYVPTKRDLEALVLERLMLESAPPDEPTGDWRQDLASVAYAARANLLRHEWMIDVFSSASAISIEGLGQGFLRHVENSIRMTEGLPFDFRTKMGIIALLDDFTRGATVTEIVDRRRWAATGIGPEEFQHQMTPQMMELFAQSSYPLVDLFREHDAATEDPAAQFELGLQLILDGVAYRIAQQSTPSRAEQADAST